MKKFYYYGLRWRENQENEYYQAVLWCVESDSEHQACEDAKQLHSKIAGAIMRGKMVVDDYFRWYGEAKEAR